MFYCGRDYIGFVSITRSRDVSDAPFYRGGDNLDLLPSQGKEAII
jgi:hypothetical protein